ncbi:MAG TPA: Ltp family lipoprotein [Caulobacter sp.]|nr:Ltp family lipoprotein [Caulobacter sp.]
MTETIISASQASGATRRVGAALGIGIFLLPWIFAWFLLRRGYSTLARLIAFGWLLAFILFAIVGGGGSNQVATANSAPTAAAPATATAGKRAVGKRTTTNSNAGSAVSTEPAPEAATGLTSSQKNAARSATQYLRMSGFSREGLIDQLSSSAGDGYDVADATAAVDSLDVDWNENAVRSAKQYLSMSGFSCKGLIEQLSSSAGDKYTVTQATFGARQAGACS